jgi:multimeric flavodoxin WrbA
MSVDAPTIVVINASPRRTGMTARLAAAALRGAEREGARVVLLHLADEALESCRSCGGDCWTSLACVRDSAAGARAARLQEADGIVMAAPVYCWQLNSLASLFIDKMRWNTGSVLQPRNTRAAMGIASAGGSGTGCVLALQTLYKYFANWAFHGVAPLPVTRFNFPEALDAAEEGGRSLVRTVRKGIAPFADLGEAMLAYESLPFMAWSMIDELALIVRQMSAGMPSRAQEKDPAAAWRVEADKALALHASGDRTAAAAALAAAYARGAELWEDRAQAGNDSRG